MSFSPIRLKHSPMDEPRKSSRWIFPGWRARACRSMNVGCTMAAGDDICRIALTSGSTGEAKVVAFTHNNQLARLARTITCSEKHFLNARDFSAIIGSVQAGLPAHSLCAVTWRYDVFSRRFADGNSANVRAVQGAGADRLAGRPQRIFTILRGQCRFPIRLPGHHLGRKAAPQIVVRTGAGKAVFESHFYYGTTETSTVSSAPAHALTGVAGGRGIYRARCIGAGRR